MQQKATMEDIISAYQQTGSVWKAGKHLGLVGQSVWERLKSIDYPMASRSWTKEEIEELKNLSNHCPIGEIARRLGRPYHGIANKMSRLGLTGGKLSKEKSIPRGQGYDKATTQRRTSKLNTYQGSLKQFCRSEGINIESFARAVQRHFPDFWKEYTESRSDLEETVCPYCGDAFFPMSKKQKMCTRKCSDTARKDRQYFGGKRRQTIGLASGICQLCERKVKKGLSSHHVLGKENDPENDYLIALCQGCHKIVSLLAGRNFIKKVEAWENLIQLCLLRNVKTLMPETTSVYTCVEIKEIKEEEEYGT